MLCLPVETGAPPVKQTASFKIKDAKCHLHPKLTGRAEDRGRALGPGEGPHPAYMPDLGNDGLTKKLTIQLQCILFSVCLIFSVCIFNSKFVGKWVSVYLLHSNPHCDYVQ